VRLGRWLRRHQPLVAGVGALLLTAVVALAVSTLLVGRALEREQRARAERALAQVEQLRTANAQAVPAILEGLAPFRPDILPRLRELWDQPVEPGQRPARMRIGLALLPVEPERVRRPLYDWMLETDDPRELLLVRDALQPYGRELVGDLWRMVEAPRTAAARLRALVALAAFDDGNPRWQTAGVETVEQLLGENPLFLGVWTVALRPVRGALLAPLGEVFRGHKLADKREVAASVLAVYAADRPDLLADLIAEADERQYQALLPRVREQHAAVLPRLRAELTKVPPAQASDAERDALAYRQANAAVTLLHLGAAEPAWPLLQHSSDPSRRTWLVHGLAPRGIDIQEVARRLAVEADVSGRRALLLALGEYPAERLPASERQALVARLVQAYRDDPDAGLHGAIEWLLRQWKEPANLPRLMNHRPTGKGSGAPTWYVNGQGQTFTVIAGPVEFLMGSPEQEPDRSPAENRHRRRIPRSYALGTKEVTVAEFRRFLNANPEIKQAFDAEGQAAAYLQKYSPAPDGPIILVPWYMAVQYCNWLSQVEGIPAAQWCYPKELARIWPGREMKPGYLSRTGYRLPTEAEWEYACRAGAETSRFYGTSERLLGKYAWYSKTTADAGVRSGGLLKPNDWGLFDSYGNVVEWCQNRWRNPYPVPGGGGTLEDDEDKDNKGTEGRVLRGGAFSDHAMLLRSAARHDYLAAARFHLVGLRVARTVR
jgi:formylglycine-generating enzyme required for sulfatase activity